MDLLTPTRTVGRVVARAPGTRRRVRCIHRPFTLVVSTLAKFRLVLIPSSYTSALERRQAQNVSVAVTQI